MKMHAAGSPETGTADWNRHWNDHETANKLNPAQIYRRDLIFRLLALRDAKAPIRVLDLGCGAGELDMHLIRQHPGIELLGLDMSEVGIEIARGKVPGAQFRQQDFTKPIAFEGFDRWATHAVCTEVLEHLDDPVAMLRNVSTLFATGCKLVITVPAGPMSAFDRHIGHRRHYTAASLRQIIREAGLEAVDVRGAGFPFFNLYRLAVIARGEKLIDDAAKGDGSNLPLTARAAIRAFGALFKLDTDRTTLGWQLVAVASPR